MHEIKVFEQFAGVVNAGFTTKPEKSDLVRKQMAESGAYGCVVKANLVHGSDVCIIEKGVFEAAPYAAVDDCDALMTNMPGVVLTTTHGDCIPVFACSSDGKAVGLAHAGWKGTVLGIAANLVWNMSREYNINPKDIYVYIGPGIDSCCFEVDKDVAEKFLDEIPWAEDYIIEDHVSGKYRIDLKGINSEFAESVDIPAENIEISGECTCCIENKSKYWSYRRDKDTERMLAYIYII